MSGSKIKIKRGDTLPLAGVVTIRNEGVDISSTIDFSTWEISGQVRSGPKNTDPLLATAVLAFIGVTNSFTGTIAPVDTDLFPEKCYLDLRFKDDNGVIQSTQTLLLEVEDSVSDAPP